MGLSLSLLLSACKDTLKTMIYSNSDNANTVTLRSFSFNKRNGKMIVRTYSFKKNDSESISKTDVSDKMTLERSLSFKKWEPENSKLKSNLSFKNLVLDSQDASLNSPKNKEPEHSKLRSNLSFKNLVLDSHDASSNAPKSKENDAIRRPKPTIILPEPVFLFSPRPVTELDAAAIKLQKVYKSYRTRRNLADCAVVVEELWWKALDFASLKRSSVSFFNIDKHETAVSRWSRARTRAAKVGKGLSKDEKAQKLALQHWLEAIDPRHRYGHNLHFYYDIWFDSESTQPFFYWLDIGDGKEINLEKCPRTNLQRQCIKYLGPKERECYEVVVESGKLVFRQSGILVNTVGDSKWIFVLSTSRSLYVGKKQKGVFQHSSFLAGGATTAAGRLVAQEGVLEAIWPYSGHYHPTEENFKEFVSFLEEHNVDLTNVKKCAIDEDNYELRNTSSGSSNTDIVEVITTAPLETSVAAVVTAATEHHKQMESDAEVTAKCPAFEYGKRLSCKWSTGAGPRIGCVRDYPSELQNQALEHVNLSPRLTPGSYRNNGPIPSPRPSPKYRVSPRLAYMGVPSPRVSIRASG